MKLRLVFLFGCTAMVSACSTFHAATQANDKALGHIKLAKAKAAGPAFVTVSSAPYLLGAEIAQPKAASPLLKLPVTYKSRLPATIRHIAGVITEQTGVPVEIGDTGGASLQDAVSYSGAGAGGLPPPPAALLRQTADTSSSLPRIRIWYSGPLKGLVDEVDAKTGLSSRISDGRLRFFRTETRTFDIPALPQTGDAKSEIQATSGSTEGGGLGSTVGGGVGSTAGGSSGTGSGGQTSIKMESKTDIWKSLTATAKIVARGGQVVVDRSLGTVTITGTPDQVAGVREWVTGLGKSLERMVSVTVKVYDVQLSNEQNYGFDPTVAFRNAARAYGLTISGGSIPQVLGQETPGTFGATILGKGHFGGTKLAFQALATLGHVSQVFERSFTALNNEQVPIQVGTNQQYPAESLATLAANVGSQTAVIPGQATTGFTGYFFPRIVGNKVLLAMNMKLQTLNDLKQINGLEYPTTSHSVFDQTVALRSGSTLMATGFENSSASNTHNGTGSPYLPLLGGGADAQVKRNLIAIVVTARIL